ncbi:MAG: hypothetical protein WC421_05250 [Elusimicrobiales bacterium]
MKTAYLSVWSKKGIAELAYGLHAAGYELLASGSTAKIIAQAELEVNEGLDEPPRPEQIVRTLEAAPDCARELEDAGIPRPDVVVCNFYPVAEMTAQEGFSIEELAQYMDIWNNAVLRAAARAWETTAVLCDFSDYAITLAAIAEFNEIPPRRRRQLAVKALMRCAYYDATAAQFLAERRGDMLGDELVLALKQQAALAYGENPQQQAALYDISGARPWGVSQSRIIHGRPLSFNHYLDLDCAWETACEFTGAACVIVKHGAPCGAACAHNTAEAFRLAFDTDRQGAPGGTAVFNRRLTEKAAQLLDGEVFELIAAPDFEDGALDILRSRRRNRLALIPSMLASAGETEMRSISGGVLVQEKDPGAQAGFEPASRRHPGPGEEISLRFAMNVAKHARSYAAVIAQGVKTVAIASGHPSRRESVKIALLKAREKHPIVDAASPLVLACDTALPPDCVKQAAKAGIGAIIQPGGAPDDADCAAVADSANIAMAFTGKRYLRH